MKHSYDMIGDIAVIEMSGEGRPEVIARDIRRIHPRVKTVLARTGERQGRFRLWKMKKIFGKETETVHKEHGFRFLLDPTKVYFSPREATERERIASMVKKGETVMVMFAGVGPYGIVIAGKQPGVRKVYQVEMNPAGFTYMKRNISMNRLGHKVVPVLGDVKDAVKDYEGLCDRVVMPLPRQAHEFLGPAMRCLREKGLIHLYSVGRHAKGVRGKQADEELFGEAVQRLEDTARKSGRSVKILARRKVLPFSPGAWKICIDAAVKRRSATRPTRGRASRAAKGRQGGA